MNGGERAEVQAALRGALPHVRSAYNRLQEQPQVLPPLLMLEILTRYCQEHPRMKSIARIVNAVVQIMEDMGAGAEGGGDNPADDDAPADDNAVNGVPPVEEIMSIFPRAKTLVVKQLLRTHRDQETVIHHMLEHGYEKKEAPPAAPAAAAAAAAEPPKQELDYTSTKWETNAEYRKEAMKLLLSDFPCLRANSIEKIFVANNHHYYPTFKALEIECELDDIMRQVGSTEVKVVQGRQLRKRKRASPTAALSAEVAALIKQRLEAKNSDVVALSTLREGGYEATNPILLAEVEWAKERKRKELEEADARLAEELNEQLATDEGMMFECGCCYSESTFERLVQCSEGHLFCKACLQHYGEQTVFGNGQSRLQCMNAVGEACPGFFPESMLRKALPTKVWEKMSEASTRDALKAAQIENMVMCFSCNLEVELADTNILHCPQCAKDTCRLCKSEAHIPLRCHEVIRSAESARHRIEEALTNARIRECPKCKQRFFKVEGCNKMTCTCGTLMCYICRADITKEGYGHFHKKTKMNCVLFSDTVQDDRQAMYDAGLTAMEEIAEHSTNLLSKDDERQVLEQLLDGGVKKEKKKRR